MLWIEVQEYVVRDKAGHLVIIDEAECQKPFYLIKILQCQPIFARIDKSLALKFHENIPRHLRSSSIIDSIQFPCVAFHLFTIIKSVNFQSKHE